MTIAVIDGDLVAFRCAASCEEEDEDFIVKARCDSFIDEIITATGATSYEVWLSGSNNFRKEVYPEYKANRVDSYRPKWEKVAKDFLREQHNARTIDGAEADDALGYRTVELGEDAVCVTNDKDNKQTPGLHYDPAKKVLFRATEEDGFRFFCYQLLVGDPVDNLKGVVGIGPKKAEKILQDHDPEEWLTIIEDMYPCSEAFEQAAKCTWIWRKEGDIWQREK